MWHIIYTIFELCNVLLLAPSFLNGCYFIYFILLSCSLKKGDGLYLLSRYVLWLIPSIFFFCHQDWMYSSFCWAGWFSWGSIAYSQLRCKSIRLHSADAKECDHIFVTCKNCQCGPILSSFRCNERYWPVKRGHE